MPLTKLLPLVFVGSVAATSLRFQPDTVQAGTWLGKVSDTTVVSNLTASSLRTELKRFVSPFKHSSKLVVFRARNLATYAYRIDSATPLGANYVMHLSRLTSNPGSNYFLQSYGGSFIGGEISLAAHATLALGSFRLEECAAYPVRSLVTTATATSFCRDEPLKFVFLSNATSTDTLYARGNQFVIGSGSLQRPLGPVPLSEERQYTLDGRALTTSLPGTQIVVTPSGTGAHFR